MKIAVIGAGAMGALYGGYLSQHNEVYLVDTNPDLVEKINADGITIRETDGERCYHPTAVTSTEHLGAMDLVVMFVKSMYSAGALRSNKGLIGSDTYILTLQNGAGHEDIIKEFTDPSHIIIGTTQHNSSIVSLGCINHGGGGMTNIGSLTGETTRLQPIAEAFGTCGFPTEIFENIQKLIWKKLFVNVSVSVLTGVLQIKMGYMVDNAHGAFLLERLLKEAVAVANGEGLDFDEAQVIADTRTLIEHAREGYTSIYADLRDNRKTEVDTISGYVVRTSKKNGVPAPSHEFIVEMVHAMEERSC